MPFIRYDEIYKVRKLSHEEEETINNSSIDYINENDGVHNFKLFPETYDATGRPTGTVCRTYSPLKPYLTHVSAYKILLKSTRFKKDHNLPYESIWFDAKSNDYGIDLYFMNPDGSTRIFPVSVEKYQKYMKKAPQSLFAVYAEQIPFSENQSIMAMIDKFLPEDKYSDSYFELPNRVIENLVYIGAIASEDSICNEGERLFYRYSHKRSSDK